MAGGTAAKAGTGIAGDQHEAAEAEAGIETDATAGGAIAGTRGTAAEVETDGSGAGAGTDGNAAGAEAETEGTGAEAETGVIGAESAEEAAGAHEDKGSKASSRGLLRGAGERFFPLLLVTVTAHVLQLLDYTRQIVCNVLCPPLASYLGFLYVGLCSCAKTICV
jgi:hypothetical protein